MRLGQVLGERGEAEDALALLAEAQRRFQAMAATGNKVAERMAGVTFTETGGCLFALGRLDEAAEAYEERIRHAPSMSDLRGAAVAKFQLGTVRLLQRRHREALKIYAEARGSFETLGEPRQLAWIPTLAH